jgi:GNAT superfamily N-acetyltransferase
MTRMRSGMPDCAAPDAGDISVRRLTHDDVEGALALSSTAGWNQRVDEWRLLIDLAPAGSFAASIRNRIVGTAIGIDYGAFSWIAMMLVDPAYRGRGLGRRLLQAALDAVPAHTPVRLDATPAGRPLYRAHGFEDEATLTRWVAETPIRVPEAADGAGNASAVRRLSADDLPGVAAFDARVFGGSRRAVLRWALDSAPHYAHAIGRASAYGRGDGAGERHSGRLAEKRVQYCFGRRGRLFDQIGPVIASDEDAACALMDAALRAVDDRAAVADVFDGQSRVTSWLQACGFQPQRPLFRMRRPPQDGVGPDFSPAMGRDRVGPDFSPAMSHDVNATPLREFAIAGPEFG